MEVLKDFLVPIVIMMKKDLVNSKVKLNSPLCDNFFPFFVVFAPKFD